MNLKDIQNKHEGKLGFVIGAGPSLRNVDVEMLSGHVNISVNSSLPKVPFADYFVADDIGVKNWSYFKTDLVEKSNAVALLYKKKLKNHVSHIPTNRIIWFDHKWWYDPKNEKHNPDGLVMTKDAEAPIIGARTTAGSAVHLAYIMGCDPIVLLGCDCCYDGFKRYYWQFAGQPDCFRATGEKVFSIPNRGKYRGKFVDSHSMDFIEYWAALAKSASKQGIRVINASGGLLNSFPRATLEDVLNKYGDNN